MLENSIQAQSIDSPTSKPKNQLSIPVGLDLGLNARGVADLANSITAINRGEKNVSLTAAEIRLLSNINRETARQMKEQLNKEATTPRYNHETEADQQARTEYWNRCMAELDAAIANYKSGLDTIILGSRSGLSELKKAHAAMIAMNTPTQNESMSAIGKKIERVDLAVGIPEAAQKFGVTSDMVQLLSKYGITTTFETESSYSNDRIDFRMSNDRRIPYLTTDGTPGETSSLSLISNTNNEPLDSIVISENTKQGNNELFIELTGRQNPDIKRHYRIPKINTQTAV